MEIYYRTETGEIPDYEDLIAMIKYFISIGKTKSEIIEHEDSKTWQTITTSFPFNEIE